MNPYKNKKNPKMSSIGRKLNIIDLLMVYRISLSIPFFGGWAKTPSLNSMNNSSLGHTGILFLSKTLPSSLVLRMRKVIGC